MNFKRIKSKGFWISLIGAVIMLLQLLGLKINVPYVNEVLNSICAIMIILGIMVDDTKKPNSEDVSKNTDVSKSNNDENKD